MENVYYSHAILISYKTDNKFNKNTRELNKLSVVYKVLLNLHIFLVLYKNGIEPYAWSLHRGYIYL